MSLTKEQIERIAELEESLRLESQHREQCQHALMFWLPMVPDNDDEIAERAAQDAILLMGFDCGEVSRYPETEQSAQERGWITLRASLSASRPEPDEPLRIAAFETMAYNYFGAKASTARAAYIFYSNAIARTTPAGEEVPASKWKCPDCGQGPFFNHRGCHIPWDKE